MIAESSSQDLSFSTGNPSTMNFDSSDMALVNRFQVRTVFCLGTKVASHFFYDEPLYLIFQLEEDHLQSLPSNTCDYLVITN